MARTESKHIEIHNTDCIEYMQFLPNNFYDWAIVDPPYFNGPQKLGYYGNKCSKTGVKRNGYKKLGTWDLPSIEYFQELKRVSKNQIIWGINYFPWAIETFTGSGRIIWDKINTTSTYSDCEIAYCSSIDKVIQFDFMWNGMLQGCPNDGRKMQGNKKLNERRIHPTQKPIALYSWILNKFCQKNNNILDTHLGSASAAIAAHRARINFTGIEISTEYTNLAINRIKQETNQLELF